MEYERPSGSMCNLASYRYLDWSQDSPCGNILFLNLFTLTLRRHNLLTCILGSSLCLVEGMFALIEEVVVAFEVSVLVC